MDLKSSGLYSCRTLSFNSVTFHHQIVPSTEEFAQCYNAIAQYDFIYYLLFLHDHKIYHTITYLLLGLYSHLLGLYSHLLGLCSHLLGLSSHIVLQVDD